MTKNINCLIDHKGSPCTCDLSMYEKLNNPMSNSTQNDYESEIDKNKLILKGMNKAIDILKIPQWSEALQEAYDKGYEKGVADARREVIEEIENKLESIQFVYEHQWTDEAVEKLCERCGEVIKIGTPCEASIHITCWKLLESVLATLRKEEKHG